MGKPGAYLVQGRVAHGERPTREAVLDYREYIEPLSLDDQETQASRCMACGVAFCQTGMAFNGAKRTTGCPLHNLIPEWNDLLYRGRVSDAAARLALTNPFPEFTGRVCPAPCEVACNLGLHDEAVTTHDNERAISDYAWAHDLVAPLPKPASDAPLVTVVGSGPAGLAVAWRLARRGARVRVLERDDTPGGLLMYGIPEMKLPKDVVLRRVDLMRESGIEFECGTDAEKNSSGILTISDAVVVAAGARDARTLNVPGEDLEGVYPALDYLTDSTKAVRANISPKISTKDKDVVVLGGGDTGVDCIATALRQGARSVTQVIRATRKPDAADIDVFEVWPGPRGTLDTGYGQREFIDLHGNDPRVWSTDTVGFTADKGGAAVAHVQLADLSYEGGRHRVEGTEREIDAQIVLVAKGFNGPEASLFNVLGVKVDDASRNARPKLEAGSHRAVRTEGDATPVYVAGDARNGSTLVVQAIADGIACADEVADLLL